MTEQNYNDILEYIQSGEDDCITGCQSANFLASHLATLIPKHEATTQELERVKEQLARAELVVEKAERAIEICVPEAATEDAFYTALNAYKEKSDE